MPLKMEDPIFKIEKSALTLKNNVESTLKRKREENQKSIVTESFTIQPYASSDSQKPINITPKFLIHRSLLPLHWLGSGVTPRLFQADIGHLSSPRTVLIAKYENERQLAAIERVDNDVFSLSRLSVHIKMPDVRKLSGIDVSGDVVDPVVEYLLRPGKRAKPTPVKEKALPLSEESPGTEVEKDEVKPVANGGGSAKISIKIEEDHGLSDDPLGLSVDVLPPRALEMPESSARLQTTIPETMKIIKTPKPKSQLRKDDGTPQQYDQTAGEDDLPPVPEDVLSQIYSQYYETLYMEKTSLAYFAKSTLSRARVIFRLDNPAPSSRLDLLNFLRTLLMPIERCDEKYRNTIYQVTNEDPIDDKTLFNDQELSYVERWVEKTMSDEKTLSKSAEQNDQRLKRKIKGLRLRETQLQIIILLEILAISSKFPASVINPKKTKKQRKKVTKKATPEPSVHLDLLVDRLCIWQSIGMELGISDDEDEEQQQQQASDKTLSEEDHIEHFSVEVVMAFYYSRLPEICAGIKRRCHGKAPISSYPKKQAIKDEKKKKPTMETTTIAKTTTRTTTEIKTAKVPQRPPTLARSLTAPANLNRIEREPSCVSFAGSLAESLADHSLDVRSLSKPEPSRSSRGGAMTSKRLDKRQIEMSRSRKGSVNGEDARSKANQDLQNAIRGISKPNRAAAADQYSQSLSQRVGGGGRKQRKPLHKPNANVQVIATPRKNHRVQQISGFKPLFPNLPIVEEPRSEDLVVPQSTVRGRKRKDFSADVHVDAPSTPTKVRRVENPRMALQPADNLHNIASSPNPFAPRLLSNSFAKCAKDRTIIEDTPQKPKAKLRQSFLASNGTLGDTPTKIPTTPLGKKFGSDDDENDDGGVALCFESPLPPRSAAASKLRATPIGNTPRIVEEDYFEAGGVSIYEQLGWD